jgi:hypothetical protein
MSDTVAPHAEPLIAALLAVHDASSADLRAALALTEGTMTAEDLIPVEVELREIAARARALDRQRDALVHQLAQAGYTAAMVEQAIIAAGRADALEDLEDTLAELDDYSQHIDR